MKKFNLNDLKVQSFITEFKNSEEKTIYGGGESGLSCGGSCEDNQECQGWRSDMDHCGNGLTDNCYAWSYECVSAKCDHPVAK